MFDNITAANILIPIAIFLALGLLAGLLLTIFSKIFAEKSDEQFDNVRAALPGLNCGVCGYKGCDNYAHEMIDHAVAANKCVPGGDATSKKLSEILKTHFADVEEQVAAVHCGGMAPSADESNYIYMGEKTCTAANLFYQGKGGCEHRCLGYGDCAKACPYGAITIKDGVAAVNPEICVGCSMCVSRCPKELISIMPQEKKVYVACSGQCIDKNESSVPRCTNGCIGCKKCEKVCPSGAITVIDKVAKIDYDKCVGCMECAASCPTKCIKK